MDHYGHSQIDRLNVHLRYKCHEEAYGNGMHGITLNLIRAYQNYRACEGLILLSVRRVTVYCDNLGLSKEVGRYFDLLGSYFSDLESGLASRFEH